MKQITLINPPTVLAMGSLNHQTTTPPLGLAYLSAVAKESGHRVQVIDAPGDAINAFHPLEGAVSGLHIHGLTPDEIVRRIDPASDLVGITHMFLHAWPLLRFLVARIKETRPDLTVVLGGETPTCWWSHMMTESPHIDICALGEGEGVLVDLLDAVDRSTPWSQVAGIAYRADDGLPVRSEGVRQRLVDLEAIPRPDWDVFNVETYLQEGYSTGVNRGRSMPMLATRGCPYRCTFCSSPAMWTTRYVMRDPRSVVDEVEDYVRRYRIDNVDFLDLTAIVNRRWILEFCKELTERAIEISWQLPQGTRSEAIDSEVAEALYRSGCRNIGYAPESGSPRMLKLIKKRVNLPNMVESLTGSTRVGMITSVAIILGLPGERWKDVWLSYKLIMRLAIKGVHSAGIMLFSPYPGSELFDQLVESGKLAFTDEHYYGARLRSGQATVSYNDFDPRVLVGLQLWFALSFWSVQYVLRPMRLVRTLGQLFTRGKETTVMDKLLNAKLAVRRWRQKAAKAPVSIAMKPTIAVRDCLEIHSEAKARAKAV